MRQLHLVLIVVLLAFGLSAAPAQAKSAVVTVCNLQHLSAALQRVMGDPTHPLPATITFACSTTTPIVTPFGIMVASGNYLTDLTVDGSGQTVL